MLELFWFFVKHLFYADKVSNSCPEMFCKKGVLKNFAKFTGKQLCKTPALVFSCEFFDAFKKTYFIQHLQTTASVKNLYIVH